MVADFAVYGRTRQMLVTGDFHMYWNMLRLVMKQPDKFLHIPGAFHVMLNAQQWYRSIVEKLWTAAYPENKLPWFEVALKCKYILDLLCRAWKDARA